MDGCNMCIVLHGKFPFSYCIFSLKGETEWITGDIAEVEGVEVCFAGWYSIAVENLVPVGLEF